ncbi:MAG: histidinol-phosphate transaminase [Bdellovibrionales bacterium RIFOXYB1_FULL_37_110]|nr:MAG: histidinol-phosphate transaminase [Bdellovibrionales bacterium RIFOXYC1_FULL_37_79]OFZ59855.1 MAG: histidinol-phosphate transaminase [Bdellovibrionales bacterium RIFOXYB1_FULL_37_110]OFZ63048.1 MAG: histidinol-phosphate transaminase [Bdellovibrionales bacterium RIFOXYB2_FULL_36_6]OFZ65469.1 MAG: histidinol-phosphate transaminase [Bdellovibrionales bacterium RIFOXYD1_FULL_36_51]
MDSNSHFKHAELVPPYIQNLKPYQAGKPATELARERGLTKISKIASNENPLGPSPYAIKAMTQGLWDLHQYPDMHAYQLKSMLSDLYKLKKENIILGNGSEGIMANIFRTFVRPGDEILTSEKTFIGFFVLASGSGSKLITTPLTEDFRFDVKKIAAQIHQNTKIIYIANPNNPTGTYITKEEFDYLMKFVPSHTLVILDEAYFEFAQGKEDYPDSMDYRYDNVITLRTFSKAYGLAGIRVGYGFAHEYLIGNLTKIKLPFEPNLIAQLGACAALRDTPHLKKTLKNNEKRYHEAFKFLKKNDLEPIKSVANFITIKTGSEQASNWIFEMLLNRGVIIRPLKANEMSDFLRISLGSKDEMNHFYESMTEILPEYQRIKNQIKN